MREDHGPFSLGPFRTTTNQPEAPVQISVPDALAYAVTSLTGLLATALERANDLQERNDRQSELIEDKDSTLEVVGNRLREQDDEIRSLHEIIKQDGRDEEIARLAGELESTRNALDARGKTIDDLQAQLDAGLPKVGDIVRIKDGAHHFLEDGSLRESDYAGHVGRLTKLGSTHGNAIVGFTKNAGPVDGGYLVRHEDLEVVR